MRGRAQFALDRAGPAQRQRPGTLGGGIAAVAGVGVLSRPPRAAIGSTHESVLPQPASTPVSSVADVNASIRRSTGVLAITPRLTGECRHFVEVAGLGWALAP